MTIFIAILTIGILVVLHEMGHFFTAKKFNIQVHEFGIGFPPKLFGIQKGETTYTINALPVGGFVRMEGEEKRSNNPRSFSEKPLWQRFVVVAAGVVVFWLIGAFIFAGLAATTGIPTVVEDEQTNVVDPRVRIIGVASGSPASEAGLEPGDTIRSMQGNDISKVHEVQDITTQYAGQGVVLVLERGSERVEQLIVPRANPPEGEGAIGIALARTGLAQYPWYEAPAQGVVRTWGVTASVFHMFGVLISGVTGGDGLPEGAQLSGPVGVIDLLKNSLELGIASYLSFVAVIAVYLAIFNTLPIPALDGGRMFFIVLEGIRRKPLPEKFEQRAIFISFMILIPLILWVTIGDLQRLL